MPLCSLLERVLARAGEEEGNGEDRKGEERKGEEEERAGGGQEESAGGAGVEADFEVEVENMGEEDERL